MFKPVAQEDPLGCGVACVAYLLNLSYKDALQMFPNGKERANTVGFYSKELASKLGESYKVGFAKRNKKFIHRSGSIIFMKRGKKYRCGHFMVRSGNQWMDPWINFPSWAPRAGFRKRLPEQSVYIIFAAQQGFEPR